MTQAAKEKRSLASLVEFSMHREPRLAHCPGGENITLSLSLRSLASSSVFAILFLYILHLTVGAAVASFYHRLKCDL